MSYEIKQDNKFKFIEEGEGEPLVLLHGLFGALSNFESLINYFKQYNKVVVPILPLAWTWIFCILQLGDWQSLSTNSLKQEDIRMFIYWEIPLAAM